MDRDEVQSPEIVLCGGSMKFAVLTALLFLSGLAARAQAPQAWDAKSIVWQDIEPDGTKYSVLEGDRSVPGKAFTYAFFIPAGYWEHHWHSQDARVAVIQGELKVAFSDTLDKAGAKGYPVGSYLLVPANVKHTIGRRGGHYHHRHRCRAVGDAPQRGS